MAKFSEYLITFGFPNEKWMMDGKTAENFFRAKNESLHQKILELENRVNELESRLIETKKVEIDFQIFFRESAYGMILFDYNQRVIDVNDSFLKITGFRKQQVILLSFHEFINILVSEKNRDKVICVISNMIHGNFVKPLEIEFNEKFLEISFHSSNHQTNLIGIISDITSRKEAEIKLSESELNLRSLFNGMTEIVFEIDYDGRYLNIAPTAPGLMYRPTESAIGKTLHDLFPKEQADVFLNFVRSCFEQKTPQTIEYPLIIEGKKLWFEGRASLKTENTVLFIAHEITEQKEAEEALNLSEEKFQNFILSLQDGIRITNPKGVIIAWNKEMERITGISQEEAIGSFTWDITYRLTPPEIKTPDLYEKIKGHFLHSIETGITNWLKPENEYKVQRPDGKICFVHTSIFPVKTSAGLSFGSIVRDITDSKRNAEILQFERNLLQGLFDNLLVGIVLWDNAGNLIKANRRFYELTGYSNDEITNREDWLGMAYPDPTYRQTVKDEWNLSARLTGAIKEFRIRCKNGAFKDIEFMVSFLQDKRTIVSMADISERKQSEEAIRRKDVLLEASARASQLLLADSPLDTIVSQALLTIGKAIDRDRVYVFEFHEEPETGGMLMSQRYEWVKEGISAQINNPELQNVPVNDVAPRWFELLSKGMAVKGNIKDFPETERVALEAQDIVSILVMPVVVSSKCWGFVGFDNCTSEDNWIEAESLILKSFSLTIGMAIIRRRAEIDLRKAKEKAEEYNNLKTAFLQNMSHEIRTPMNGILGFTELLNDPELPGEAQQEYLQIIKSSGERMLNIINDLLDVSLIESGQVEVNKSNINLYDEMMSVYRFFKPEADSKSLRFLLIDGDSDPKRIIFTDKEKFFAILSNLIKNAIKFTNSGFVEMGYSIKQNEYEFFVKDSGIGIANEKLEIIFERFVQADLSISRPYEGAGLGLAIAKEYVEMLGGRIWVESQPGAGSQFYFTVPASESGNAALKEREMLYKMTPGTDSTISILIAEDTEHSDLYLTQCVKKFCKTIFHVKTGTQAVEVCKNNPDIDLILIDIKMPEMDGYQATRLIRQFNQKVVIIAQTAYALTGDREKALHAGCNEYLAKPVGRDTLLRVISRFFPLV